MRPFWTCPEAALNDAREALQERGARYCRLTVKSVHVGLFEAVPIELVVAGWR